MTIFSKKRPSEPSPDVVALITSMQQLMMGIRDSIETLEETNNATMRQMTEEFNAIMPEIQALNKKLDRFVSLQSEMIANLSRYMQYEVDAINASLSEDAKKEPTEHDAMF